MDWSMLGYSAKPADGDELVDDDDNEDFYGDESSPSEADGFGKAATAQVASNIHPSSTMTARSPLPSIPSPRSASSVPQQTSEQKPKTENQLRAQELRAILLAKRQNTPAKSPRPATPVTNPSKLNPAGASVPRLVEKRKSEQQQEEGTMHKASTEALDSVEQLIAQGKAAAEAQAAALSGNANLGRKMNGGATRADAAGTANISENQATNSPGASRTMAANHSSFQPFSKSAVSNHVADSSYYDDLALWLELTNYHDVSFRKAQLQPYVERKALEAEAARIQERIAMLDQAQQANPPVFRFGTPTASSHPPLPQSLPVPPSALKRPHSPETHSTPVEKFARREPPGSRLRGGGDSPSFRQGRPRSRSPSGLGGFADSHRRSDGFDDRSRDASLERRQARYYNHSSNHRREDNFRPEPYPARQNSFRDERGYESRGIQPSNRSFSYRGGGRGGFS